MHNKNNSEKAPGSKRRKLDHARFSRQDKARHSPDHGEAESAVHQAMRLGPLDLKSPNAGNSRAGESNPTTIHVGDMHRLSIFKLQVDEMLRAVQPNYAKLMEPIDKALRKLKTLIKTIEDQEPLTVAEAVKFMHKSHKITIPFPDPPPDKDAAFKLTYSEPSEVNVVGSYALKTMIKGDHTLAVDMAVTLPPSILQDKDYLNYRYFYKRAYYLACLAAGLQNRCSDDFEFYFEYLGGNSLQPVLVVKPAGNSSFSSSKFLIHIIPAAPQDCFVESKLRLNKNALRPSTKSIDGNRLLAPTPFYNATIRADSNISPYFNLLHRTSSHTGGFKDACVLGRIWLRQRGFGGSISTGGFGHFEWAVLSALLLQGGGSKGQSILSPAYSSYQLFKAVIQYLSSTDLVANPVLFHTPEVPIHNSNSPVFYDGPRGHNILFKMTPWSYAVLLEEAKISFEMLNDSAFDQFEATFILKKDNLLQDFDMVFQLYNLTTSEEHPAPDHANHASAVSKVYTVLKEGLTDRVKMIQIKLQGSIPWPLKSTPSVTSAEMLVGVTFDPANAERLVDHGPAAEDKNAAAIFRKFWGEKAELRRFKDGSILESLVWSNSLDGSVIKEIVIYLLNRHLGAKVSEKIKFLGHNFFHTVLGSESSTLTFSNLNAAFNTLEQDIRDIESLPLQPKTIIAIGPQLRFSSVAPPSFGPKRHFREPVEVIIQFERSGRWPDDITAIQRTKVAFLLKISDCLTSSVDGLIARLRLENVEQSIFNCGVLDVLYPSGAFFRLRIYIDREKILLEHLIKEKSVDIHTREEAISAKSLITYMFIQLPLHAQSVITYCMRYPALSPTIRLVKKWFNSHMLFGHVREEVVELIVLRTFLHPYPWRAPYSSSTGLLRTLQFISRWDWRTTPLIVDFSGTMTSDDVTALNTRLVAWRKIDPEMKRTVLFAASNHDVTGIAFTNAGPSKVVAARMTALARSACRKAKDQALNLDLETLFRSSTADYDFVLHISPTFATLPKEKNGRKTKKFKNLEIQAQEDLSLVGYEPVLLFLEELQQLYTTSIVFFYDPFPRLIIGGLWNPYTESVPLKTNLPYCTRPLPKDSCENVESGVGINKPDILSDIARLGGDMVASIEVHR